MSEKVQRKYVGVLRNLAQSEGSITSKIKVIVSKGEIVETNNKIIIAPSKFKKKSEDSVGENSTENTFVNIIEDLSSVKKTSSPHYIETEDYPDSSDFSDDE